jgi:Kef-type K+ transport system membrane component KefB
LEVDLELIRSKGKTALLVGFIGIVVPFATAIPLIWILGGSAYTSISNKGVYYIFLGVVLSISALPVLARILAELRLFTSPIGVFLLAATSCDDLYAWPLLAITIALAGATSLLSVLWLALSAIALILLLTFVVRPLFIFMAKKTKHYETPPQIVQLIILITLFLISWCGEIIGLTALVAAFAVGMLVPRSPGNIAAYLTTRIEDIVTMVFLPIFFTISGLRTQIGLLDTSPFSVFFRTRHELSMLSKSDKRYSD